MATINKPYLKLYTSCILVKGYIRSIIIDTQRNNFHFIPNDLYDILTYHSNLTTAELYSLYKNDSETIGEYIHFLMLNELAFYTDEPNSFPPISKEWEEPRIISNAILDISKSSTYDILNAIIEIDKLGAEVIQIRIFDGKNMSWLLELLSNITYQTKRIRSLELILDQDSSFNGSLDFESEMEKFELLSLVIIHSSNKNEFKDGDVIPFVYTKEKITDERHCGIINPSFFSCNINHVLEALNYNTCLNKKISINSNGEIKNCPSMNESFGQINEISLREVANLPKFQNKWHIKKDNISICKDCEFRLICSDCRAYVKNDIDKPLKCTYDPYTGKWEN